MRAAVLLILFAVLGGVSAPARAGEPPKPDVRFFRKKLKSKTMETAWYRYRMGRHLVFDHIHPVLARQGLALNKDYFLDRNDALGVLAVTGTPEAVDLALKVLAYLDEGHPQISINVRIVSVNSRRYSTSLPRVTTRIFCRRKCSR